MKNTHCPEETEGETSSQGKQRKDYLMRRLKGRTAVVVLEQLLRGLVHTVQFSVSYCIMLLFMYSNGKSVLILMLQWQ